jgi:hypothetical protein
MGQIKFIRVKLQENQSFWGQLRAKLKKFTAKNYFAKDAKL